MSFPVPRRVFLATLFSTTALAHPIYAGCTFSGSVATCTGDVQYGAVVVNLQELIFKSLTSNIELSGNDPSIQLSNTGNNGQNGKPPTNGKSPLSAKITYDGTDSSIINGGPAIRSETKGGKGGNGKERDALCCVKSYNGGAGGASSTATTIVNDASIAWALAGVSSMTTGGNGGTGGALSAGGGDVTGGRGGNGGNGQAATTTVEEAAIYLSGPGPAVAALSVGGNGGLGGLGVSLVTKTKKNAGGAIGGAGGTGGAGGNVSVQINQGGGEATFSTSGALSHGVRASSTAGSGGDGGPGTSRFIGNGKGGNGGAGGSGGTASVSVSNTKITTKGMDAQGILAESYGGAGGDGGSGDAFAGKGKGGAGAGSGPGGTVNVTTDATISTTGINGSGILAQSVGGFAGAGGIAVGFVAYSAGDQSAGRGGAVNVTTTDGASIATQGLAADGISALSIGGGGGKASAAIGVEALGSTGSAGGNGGAVKVDNAADITVSGIVANGLYAHSVGGGGGSGGSADAIKALGGSGGSGGSGGAVTVTNSGDITAGGLAAAGVVAASTGGGGGATHSTNGLVAMGGSGGGGGTGGAAAIVNTGSVATTGDFADAFHAMSLGGGGGRGSSAVSVSLGASVAIGGTGGSGGNASSAAYCDTFEGNAGSDACYGKNSPVTVSTAGHTSRGILVSSIGGGGGTGGAAISVSANPAISIGYGAAGAGGHGSSGGEVYLATAADVTTKGDNSQGVFGHSVGGGGGVGGAAITVDEGGGLSLSIAKGGSGGNGGASGAVNVTSLGSVSTAGDHSDGVAALSIAGGGGASGTTIAGGGVSAVSVDVALGSSAGKGGSAGAVTVAADGTISTSGKISTGIHAASVAGGGGAAGATIAADVAAGLSVNASLGGSGGAGGNASAVSVTSGAAITTLGEVSEGIYAASIGGGGGKSGFNLATGAIQAGAVNIAVGGSGGSGGQSSDVYVYSGGRIKTEGALSDGIEAVSTGGSGGAAKATATVGGLSMGAIQVGVGGKGGAGGSAGDVSVTSDGAITTVGPFADGIGARSVGGAGGRGGLVIEGALTAGELTGELGVSIGGAGGGGGIAGTVSVTSNNAISTFGLGASAIRAQSIGGNGGTGGSVYTGNVSVSSDGSVQANVDVGGGGGSGGTGKAVTVKNSGNLLTDSYMADAISAMSIGGNGGSGGNVGSVQGALTTGSSVNIGVSVGGGGGKGNVGGAVTVNNSGSIDTWLGGSRGIFAGSVGGGGGNGGNAANVAARLIGSSDEETLKFNLAVDVGGGGGSGNNANAVNVTNSGAITTLGVTSSGIRAFSVGGGGGSGGEASSANINVNGLCRLTPNKTSYACKATKDDTEKPVTANLDVNVGGKAGAGGNGDTVTVTNTADIVTSGNTSYAIDAYSIGGGGGTGGEGAGGYGAWTTKKTNSAFKKYFGGANITFWTTAEIGIGGSGGAAGDGEDLTITNTADLSTNGDTSFAIKAQSIGGGGGTGGVGGSGLFGPVSVGGLGSGGGDGHAVSVTNTGGSIKTIGNGSGGIFAQSVGGGGGAAGDVTKALNFEWGDLNFGVGVGIQRASGAGGDSGDVTIATGSILTFGETAHGVFAQSVAGSGGAVGISGILQEGWNPFVGNAGDSGNAGAVDVTVDGSIVVKGDYAAGVFAQSVGGTGAKDTSGGVTVTVKNKISALGEGGRGILAQSETAVPTVTPLPPSGTALAVTGATTPPQQGNVVITVAESGNVSTGEDGAETIGIFGGTNNTLTNDGFIEQNNLSGYVIRTDGLGALAVANDGYITGSVLTDEPGSGAPGSIDFVNQSGHFGSGTTIDLGNGGFTNVSGWLSAAGSGVIGTSTFDVASFQVLSGSTTDVDLNFSDTSVESDLLIIKSASEIEYAGVVAPNVIGGLPESGDKGSVQIISATGAALRAAALDVSPSPIMGYGLMTNPGSATLTYDIDYVAWMQGDASPVGDNVTANHLSFGRHVDDLIGQRKSELALGGEQFDFVEDLALFLVNASDAGDLLDIYASFAPGEVFVPADAAAMAARRFSNDLFGCGSPVNDGMVTMTGDEGCAWVRLSGTGAYRDEDGLTSSYHESIFGAAAGAEWEMGERWTLGFGAAYDRSSIDSDAFDGSGDRFMLGVFGEGQFGATTLSASLSGGWQSYDFDRGLLTPDGKVTASSDPDTSWIAGHARLTQTVPVSAQVSLAPYVDLGVAQFWNDGFRESDAGTFGLDVSSNDETLVTLNPALVVNADMTANGREMTISGRAGVYGILSDTTRLTTARLTGANGLGPAFEIRDESDRYFADLGVGIDAAFSERVTLGASVDTLFSENWAEATGTLRLEIRF
ncbi:autotransporter outer membrane beta-barrel domain-containing protein [Tropicimonas isoalkanivorans]|uniref:Autotransporter domain-containing protein n=1 Tax=Tropicimonas isoalkanivorans TaxID=441112 RepID=A0A1I1Q9V6_9RHOB|nr:autotransporter outer membrane beta-barrel domain-containing protein [Tropicimonas isoalkanivorans]SFD18732.1 hypothetical protein SAMN04488094_11920 [Tropicimonas isoalkanivorans]